MENRFHDAERIAEPFCSLFVHENPTPVSRDIRLSKKREKKDETGGNFLRKVLRYDRFEKKNSEQRDANRRWGRSG